MRDVIIKRREFRNISALEKAVILVQEHGGSVHGVAKLCDVDRNQLRRALKAIEEGRNIGVNGRPSLLTLKEEEQLISVVKENIQKNTS